LKSAGFMAHNDWIATSMSEFEEAAEKSKDSKELLLLEARLTKQLYKYAAQRTGMDGFLRDSSAGDKANDFLNPGNYLAYGLAASTLWVLGIPHGFAVMHGKTRRGALVFDIADLVKDAVVLPWSFVCAQENLTDKGFRTQCLLAFTRHKSMDFMFNQVKNIALNGPGEIPL
jgi:CRISP-associated protein Cas1